MSIIADNITRLQERIARAAKKSGRHPDEVTLVAATKQRTPAEVEEAIRCGMTVIGENRVQEAEEKRRCVSLPASWHLIGHLQTNKVKKAIELFDVIQSVDSLRLAEELNKRAGMVGKTIEVMVEVNTSKEPSKFGAAPEETIDLVRRIATLPNLRIVGLMTIGLLTEHPDEARPCFTMLRNLRDELTRAGITLPHLSMGMTHDFEAAIEEGSTMVRIGTGIFGPRPLGTPPKVFGEPSEEGR
ncbi:MAG: YggS family pyridoxal phosphate-dependent enzyme [Candidatus Latescibacteria bacterium]|nr:YggS family pyridoxal phosphate-dependent enzyme [Candidatus Latescibacterota bacterium]